MLTVLNIHVRIIRILVANILERTIKFITVYDNGLIIHSLFHNIMTLYRNILKQLKNLNFSKIIFQIVEIS